MRQVIVRGGEAAVEEIPAPAAAPGRILVRTRASCISVGTELSGLKAQLDPLWRRALKNPDKVLRAVRMMAERGVGQTMRVVQDAQGAGIAAGYSAAGEVIEVGEGVGEFAPGDRVACAGAGYAMHADVISVPTNLAVHVPETVSLKAASTVTLGAIALQGLRRLQPTLGETFVVLGLGILGQITVQLLKANGCRVIGLDLDPARVERAQRLGADAGLANAQGVPLDAMLRLTGGTGADGVVVTAAAADPTLLDTAFAMCRRKGRVVLVGDVPISIDRAAIYRNELEFLISTSYGPGRYDPAYEEQGLDYPIGYVRWTETRNMRAYLDLLAAGRVEAEALIDAEYDVAEAGAAYRSLSAPGPRRPLAVVLTYGDGAAPLSRKVATRKASAEPTEVNVALVGASAFARSVHLPNLESLKGRFRLHAVCSGMGHHANELAVSRGADYATTSLEEILGDAKVRLVLIAGRHNQHAGQALAALEAGKHVLVEKPLALEEGELAAIEQHFSVSDGGGPLLLTGFNRRFSPAIRAIQQRLAKRTGPLVVSYRMNAGHIPHTHWTQGPEGGGRNIGEACHIYDLFTALTGARAARIGAHAIGRVDGRTSRNENFSATIAFDDGSLANLVYTSLGSPGWPKETMEIYCDGQVLALDDYRSATAAGEKSPLWQGGQDKGHLAELVALADALRDGGEWPIPLWQQLQATRISFEVERQIHHQSARGEG
jgi:predicted dehydrogenase/threonine dehydrogenase-like Zn-dependent dehydrogenase